MMLDRVLQLWFLESLQHIVLKMPMQPVRRDGE